MADARAAQPYVRHVWRQPNIPGHSRRVQFRSCRPPDQQSDQQQPQDRPNGDWQPAWQSAAVACQRHAQVFPALRCQLSNMCMFGVAQIALLCGHDSTRPVADALQNQYLSCRMHVCVGMACCQGQDNLTQPQLCACVGCSLAALLYACRDGTGEIREILTCATFSPRLPGIPSYMPIVEARQPAIADKQRCVL